MFSLFQKKNAVLSYQIFRHHSSSSIHVGPNTPVKGFVYVKCNTLQGFEDDELDVPLKIVVTLSGRTKTKSSGGDRDTNSASPTHRSRATLFSTEHVVHDGPFKLNQGEGIPFGFSIHFPATPTLSPEARNIPTRFLHPEGAQLPPTVDGGGHSEDSSTYGQFFVSYRLEAGISVSDMDYVKIRKVGPSAMNIHYQGIYEGSESINQAPLQIKRNITISNAQLLPEGKRPTKFKELFVVYHFPKFSYTATARIPSVIHVGTSPTFTISASVAEFEASNTAKVQPSIYVRGVKVEITAHYTIRTERLSLGGFNEHTCMQQVYTCSSRPEQVLATLDQDHGWSWTVRTAPLPLTIAPEFKTFNISAYHSLKITWYLKCAGEATTFVAKAEAGSFTLAPPLGNGAVEKTVDMLHLEYYTPPVKANASYNSDDEHEPLPHHAPAVMSPPRPAELQDSQRPAEMSAGFPFEPAELDGTSVLPELDGASAPLPELPGCTIAKR